MNTKELLQCTSSWTPTGSSEINCACPFLFCSMHWNPTIYLHKDFVCIRSMTSRCWPLFGPRSLAMNPSETRATAGGLKDQLRSPPSVATIGAAARRLGKVWQLKSVQGLSQALALCRLAHTPIGRWRQRWPWKGKEYVLDCKLAKTLAMTLGGVWEKTSSWGDDDDDDSPRAFTTKQQNKNKLWRFRAKGLNSYDNISTLNTWIPTNDKMYFLNSHPLLIWGQMFVCDRKHQLCLCDKRLIHYLSSSLRQAVVLVTYVLSSPPPPICVFRLLSGGKMVGVCVFVASVCVCESR